MLMTNASENEASGHSVGVPPTVAGASRPRTWATLVATFFGIGRLRPGPGTWGSAATVLLWAALAHVIP
jgi:hypothetical protein